jgi:hypothetical protein
VTPTTQFPAGGESGITIAIAGSSTGTADISLTYHATSVYSSLDTVALTIAATTQTEVEVFIKEQSDLAGADLVEVNTTRAEFETDGTFIIRGSVEERDSPSPLELRIFVGGLLYGTVPNIAPCSSFEHEVSIPTGIGLVQDIGVQLFDSTAEEELFWKQISETTLSIEYGIGSLANSSEITKTDVKSFFLEEVGDKIASGIAGYANKQDVIDNWRNDDPTRTQAAGEANFKKQLDAVGLFLARGKKMGRRSFLSSLVLS